MRPDHLSLSFLTFRHSSFGAGTQPGRNCVLFYSTFSRNFFYLQLQPQNFFGFIDISLKKTILENGICKGLIFSVCCLTLKMYFIFIFKPTVKPVSQQKEYICLLLFLTMYLDEEGEHSLSYCRTLTKSSPLFLVTSFKPI